MTANSTEPRARRPKSNLTPERLSLFTLFVMGSLIVLALAYAPDYGRSVVHGPMTPGHEAMACTHCHAAAPGTMRQQAQANVRYWLGLRKTPVSFGHEPVTSAACLTCHARENDRHPTFRFREPRFAAANQSLDARSCLSCHAEHRNQRMTANAEFCQLCHQDLKPRIDPINPGHAQLVQDAKWETCLTCHDFHGNHPVKAPVAHDAAHDLAAVRSYLADGPDPYSKARIHEAKQP
jgi:hypothetical protein